MIKKATSNQRCIHPSRSDVHPDVGGVGPGGGHGGGMGQGGILFNEIIPFLSLKGEGPVYRVKGVLGEFGSIFYFVQTVAVLRCRRVRRKQTYV